MKGIILAGGTGSRLYPLTKVTNKHLLPVGKKPMILHLVDKLVEAKIKDIMVVSGTEHMGAIISLLGSGREYGCEFTFRIQDEPDGIAGALKLCEHFVGWDNCVVLLGDNMFEDKLSLYVEGFDGAKNGCRLVLKEVDDVRRFAEAVIDGGKVVDVVEKPQNPRTNLCVTGIYVYSPQIFAVLKKLQKSARGEYEITAANYIFVNAGAVDYKIMSGWWSDAGTFDSYFSANQIMAGK